MPSFYRDGTSYSEDTASTFCNVPTDRTINAVGKAFSPRNHRIMSVIVQDYHLK
jgi:hypothetical protein